MCNGSVSSLHRYSIEWYILEAEKSRNRPAKEEAPLTPALLALTGMLGGTAVLLAMRYAVTSPRPAGSPERDERTVCACARVCVCVRACARRDERERESHRELQRATTETRARERRRRMRES